MTGKPGQKDKGRAHLYLVDVERSGNVNNESWIRRIIALSINATIINQKTFFALKHLMEGRSLLEYMIVFLGECSSSDVA